MNNHAEHKLIHAVNNLIERIDHMALVWERLQTQIASLKTVEQSLIALVTTFTQAVKDAVANAADLADAQIKIDALEADFKGQSDAMAAAVAAGQAGAPVPPVPTDPTTGAPVDPNAPVIDPNVPDGASLRRRR